MDSDYPDWRKRACGALEAAGLAVPDAYLLETAFEDGLEPDELPAALPRYIPAFQRQITGTVSEMIAQHKPADS